LSKTFNSPVFELVLYIALAAAFIVSLIIYVKNSRKYNEFKATMGEDPEYVITNDTQDKLDYSSAPSGCLYYSVERPAVLAATSSCSELSMDDCAGYYEDNENEKQLCIPLRKKNDGTETCKASNSFEGDEYDKLVDIITMTLKSKKRTGRIMSYCAAQDHPQIQQDCTNDDNSELVDVVAINNEDIPESLKRTKFKACRSKPLTHKVTFFKNEMFKKKSSPKERSE